MLYLKKIPGVDLVVLYVSVDIKPFVGKAEIKFPAYE